MSSSQNYFFYIGLVTEKLDLKIVFIVTNHQRSKSYEIKTG